MSDDWKQGFGELTGKIHSDQAKWWLNGFWEEDGDKFADQSKFSIYTPPRPITTLKPSPRDLLVWDITHTFIELDLGYPVLYGSKMREYKEGCDLDEMKSHVILEKLGETMTVRELRTRLQKLDLDNNKRMALSEYLLDKFQRTPEALVNAPQGQVDPAKLEAAEALFAEASAALDQSNADAEVRALLICYLDSIFSCVQAAAKALEAAKAAATQAAASAAEAAEALKAQEAAEALVAAAVAELKAAVAELEAQEAEYNGDNLPRDVL
jgi:hypothetical protein